MKPRVLALNFQGTVAVDGRLDPAVAAVMREARCAGVLGVLLSGRMLADVLPALPEPDVFDAVVAEGGGGVQMPHGQRPFALAPGPDAALIAELERGNVAHRCGLCRVEADAVRLSAHAIHTCRSAGVAAPPDKAFFFRHPNDGTVAAARTVEELDRALASVLTASLQHHVARGDFSRWAGDVLGDADLAGGACKG